MPVYLTYASLIIDKTAVVKKCKGGIEQFRNDYFNHESEASQEDDEVFLIARMNCDEYDLDELTSMGLEYDKTKGYSNDFVIHQRSHGYLWQVDWIEDNDFHAWHTKTDKRLKDKIKEIGSKITMHDIETIYESGVEPLMIPLTLENCETHPFSIVLESKK